MGEGQMAGGEVMQDVLPGISTYPAHAFFERGWIEIDTPII